MPLTRRSFLGMLGLLPAAQALRVSNASASTHWRRILTLLAKPPWYSAMAQGVAAQAGLSVWERNGDDSYLDQAIRFGNAALADAITVPTGLWYPLYVSKPGYRVLNAHLQTVIAMADLATRNWSAQRAARKAKVNVVGAIGLVENMPDGNAQRPGDIVTSMSGQTIEIINTDAEGRLVLADVLWYVAKKHKPKFMVDLATLTGAILIALGKEHAGLFSNNDELSKRLSEAGIATGEKVWRMPLAPEYDKLIDSDVADMKNIGGRYGGAITAAQFLQRFVNGVPWAHLDIAGTAIDSARTSINQSWGSGWGVRLLDRLVTDHYEG